MGRWCYYLVRWYLAAAGAFLWVMLWWERHWFLGLAQLGYLSYGLLAELRPQLRGE